MGIDRRQLLGAVAVTGAAALAGCSERSDGGPATPTRPPPDTPGATEPQAGDDPPSKGPVKPQVSSTIATGLTVPWGIAFLKSGGALVSERDTARILFVGVSGEVRTIATLPGVQTGGANGGEGGLLGLALSPDEAELYAYLTTAQDNRVVAMGYDGQRLDSPRPILTGIPAALHHNGGRLAFGPDGYLYVSTGDAESADDAQDTGSLAGKVLRIISTGKAAPGNPFGNPVWSHGHRNIEGLAFDAGGQLWATEFGEQAVDELNLVEKGRNYGWPATEGPSDDARFTNPSVTWPTDECSPAGIAIARSYAFLGALQGQCVFAVRLDGSSTGKPRALFAGDYGRVRTVAAAPDGSLWVTTSNTDGRATPGAGDDRILRVTL